MKTKIKGILILVTSVLFVSCSFFTPSQDEDSKKEVRAIEVFPDSVKKHLMEQDSLSKQLVLAVDSITTKLNAANNNIEELQASIKELRAPGQFLIYIVIFAFFLSIIAIIATIIKTKNKLNKWEVIDEIKQFLSDKNTNLYRQLTRMDDDIKNLKKGSQSPKSPTKNELYHQGGNSQSINETIQAEIQERRMSNNSSNSEYDIRNYQYTQGNQSTTSQITKQGYAQMPKHGYAQMHTGKYLVDIVESNKESCVYSLTFTSEESAEFDIISLEKIKTINDLRDVLDLAPGSCLLNEASFHTVERKGKCKRIDDNTWEVIQKLLIKVYK